MAMNTRGRRGAASNRGRSVGVRPVFEEFRPISEWHEDDESRILTIYLPGFMKEQIRLSTEDNNTISVRGERLVAGNKWSRFVEYFHVPENCEMNLIHAKYQSGMLNIKIPKKVDKSHEALPPATETSGGTLRPLTPNRPQDKALPAIYTDVKSQVIDGRGTKGDGNDVQTDSTKSISLQMGDNSGSVAQLQQAAAQELKEKHNADDATKEEEHKSVKRKELHEDVYAGMVKSKNDIHTGASELKIKEELSKGKETTETLIIGGGFTKGKYMKVVKNLPELNEERQLLVNMGVAVLVIMGLSAYVTYKFASGKYTN